MIHHPVILIPKLVVLLIVVIVLQACPHPLCDLCGTLRALREIRKKKLSRLPWGMTLHFTTMLSKTTWNRSNHPRQSNLSRDMSFACRERLSPFPSAIFAVLCASA